MNEAAPPGSVIASRLFWSLCLVLVLHLSNWGPNSDTMARNMAALSLTLGNEHALVIDRFVANMPGGPEQFIDKATLNGHYYSGMAPGVSILLAPAGAVAGRIAWLVYPRVAHASAGGSGPMTRENVELLVLQFLGSLLLVVPLTAWAWTRLYRHLTEQLQLSTGVSLLAVAAGALCSSIAIYSTYISGKQIAAMLGLLAFTYAFASRDTERVRQRLAFAGFLTGAAVACEYTMAIFAICIFAYVAWTRTWRETVIFGLGGAVWVGVLAWYHTAAFGGPLMTAYHFRWELATGTGHTAHPAFAQFSLERLWGMTLSTYKGIFVYTPWFVLALAGFWQWLRRPDYRREILLFLAIILGFLELLSFSPVWSAGGWGMRYLLPIFPYFSIGLAIWLGDSPRSKALRWLTWALIGVAFVINYLPFGAGEASSVDPLWSAPILYVARHIMANGFSLYSVDFVARNVRALALVQRIVLHLLIYGTMFTGLAVIWRRELRATARRTS